MGVFSKLFSKKEDVVEKCTESERIANEMYERLKEKTELPVVRFTLKKETAGIFDSKIGGAFYVPKGMEVPKNEDTGNPLYLLTQLNFSQIPHIEDFPEKGVLQIFIAGDDDVYGMDFDDQTNQSCWCVRFIEELPEIISEEYIYETAWDEETALPMFKVENQYKLVGEMDRQTISYCDYRFEEYLGKYCQGIIGDEAISMADIEDDIMEILWNKLSPYACQLGGYPCFTQSDPREYTEDIREAEILLFQLDTVEDIMWGDSGVGNFFISREDLKNKDFSKVVYNWDCC